MSTHPPKRQTGPSQGIRIAIFAVRVTAQVSLAAVVAMFPAAVLVAHMDAINYLVQAMEIVKLLFIPAWLIFAVAGLFAYEWAPPRSRPAESGDAHVITVKNDEPRQSEE